MSPAAHLCGSRPQPGYCRFPVTSTDELTMRTMNADGSGQTQMTLTPVI